MKEDIIQKITKIINCDHITEREILQQLKEIYHSNAHKQVPETEPLSVSKLLFEQLSMIKNGQRQVNGIPTGFSSLDKLTGGFFENEFVVVGARPSMGKTQFLVNAALNISLSHPVLYMSYEISEQVMVSRCLSALADVETYKIISARLDDEEKQRIDIASETFNKHELFVSSYPDTDIDYLKTYCEKQIKEKKIKVIVVDYIQALSSSGYRNKREQEIANISLELKDLAREHGVCVIAASNLNRGVENRTGLQNKRPQLSDLRDSGAIEQNADKVIFIHRPEYYGFTEDEEGNSLTDIVEVNIVKNRNGVIGEVLMKKTPGFTRFVDFDHYQTDYFSFGERLNELETSD